MKKQTQSAIISLLLANVLIGTPLHIAYLSWSAKHFWSFSNFNDLQFIFKLSILLTSLSTMIGLITTLPFLLLATKLRIVSYSSITFFSMLPYFILHLLDSKQFYLDNFVISAVIGITFFKMYKSADAKQMISAA